jgi:cytochrome c-type biogenesis protein CcmH/NrfG
MKIEFELSGRKVVAIVIGALVLWFAGWQMTRLVQTSEGRVMPKRGNVPQVASFPGSEVVNDEKVVEVSLDEALIMSQQNPATLDKDKVRGAIRVLEKSVQVDPANNQNLLALADLAFTGKDFSKAFDTLSKYSSLHPEDHDVRAKMGSALTMLDRNGEAIEMLKEVVKAYPSDFKGNAYLAIALGKEGRGDEAREYMETAIAQAPNDEAASRLQGFLDSHGSFTGGAPASQSSSASTLDTWLHEHPIVGPKLQNIAINGSTLLITVKEFPMDKMPLAMRDSFVGKLWGKAEATIKEVRFLDADTSAVLYEAKR